MNNREQGNAPFAMFNHLQSMSTSTTFEQYCNITTHQYYWVKSTAATHSEGLKSNTSMCTDSVS